MLHGCFPDFYHPCQGYGGVGRHGGDALARWRHASGRGDPHRGGRRPGQRALLRDRRHELAPHRRTARSSRSSAHEDTIGMFQQLGIMPSPRTTTTPEQNLATARRYFDELLNQGRFSAWTRSWPTIFQFSLPTMPALSGKEALRGYISYLRQALRGPQVRGGARGCRVRTRWPCAGASPASTSASSTAWRLPAARLTSTASTSSSSGTARSGPSHVVANQLGLTNQMTARTAAPRHFTPEENNAIADQVLRLGLEQGRLQRAGHADCARR